MLKLLVAAVLVVASIADFLVLYALCVGVHSSLLSQPLTVLLVHSIASVIFTVTITAQSCSMASIGWKSTLVFSFCVCFSMPLVGGLGLAGALFYGIYQSNNRHREEVYWQFTKNADLPFTVPLDRSYAKHDSRGFVEQLSYSDDANDLYKKVLAAGNIRNALSVGALKTAIRHSDEKIRLTAYQTLDKKVTHLNREIQRLEEAANSQESKTKSNTWLQIASNYWELLTLERDEPIAREQLLKKASEAVLNAIKILPTNRNAHFTLGRVALQQGKNRMAVVAFERSMALGMPSEKTMPYLAEAAYDARDFKKVVESIKVIDDSFKTYPPLCHLAEYWT